MVYRHRIATFAQLRGLTRKATMIHGYLRKSARLSRSSVAWDSPLRQYEFWPPLRPAQLSTFPLHLPVTLNTAKGEYRTRTIDISAGGILFYSEAVIPVDSPVQFTIEMPREVSGTESPVLVKCQGRVVRCSVEGSGWTVDVAIDYYEFERAEKHPSPR
jgi:hypothetical protein